MKKLPIIRNLGQPVYMLIALSVSVLFFDLSYYVMKYLPGSRDQMCVIGAGFTPVNIAFSIVLSLMVGSMVAAMFALAKKRSLKMGSSSLSGFGAILGGLTVFCIPCTVPIISLFGVSVSLGFFTEFETIFKLASLVLMFGGLYLLNQQLLEKCKICVE